MMILRASMRIYRISSCARSAKIPRRSTSVTVRSMCNGAHGDELMRVVLVVDGGGYETPSRESVAITLRRPDGSVKALMRRCYRSAEAPDIIAVVGKERRVGSRVERVRDAPPVLGVQWCWSAVLVLVRVGTLREVDERLHPALRLQPAAGSRLGRSPAVSRLRSVLGLEKQELTARLLAKGRPFLPLAVAPSVSAKAIPRVLNSSLPLGVRAQRNANHACRD